jgi:hypothetical protein
MCGWREGGTRHDVGRCLLQVDILMSDREKNLEAQEAAAKADPNAGVPALQVLLLDLLI